MKNITNINRKMKFRIDLFALKSSIAKCNLPCTYCHLDYFPVSSKFDENIKYKYTDLIHMCIDATGYNDASIKLHFTGRAEPLLLDKEVFLSETQKLRRHFPAAEIVMTTNGIRLSDYSDVIILSGINKINVSHHNYSGKIEEKVLQGIEKVKSLGMNVSLNVVATEEVLKNISHFIELGDQHKITLKFFNLITEDKVYSEDLFKRFLKELKIYCANEYITDEIKNRIETFSKNGNKIIIKLSEKFHNRPEECQRCPVLKKCDESCWDTIRLTPWYIKPCGVREDNVYYPAEENLNTLKNKLKTGGKIFNIKIQHYDKRRKEKADH